MENWPEEITIQTPYLRFAARAWGPSDGRPLLALHGWLDNAASFDRIAPYLADCRLIALDMVGHGRSEHRPPGMHYHFVDYIADIVAVADALGWQEFGLLGHSLGAGVASFVAGTIPERITRLALIEGFGPWSGRAAECPDVLLKAIEQMAALATKPLPAYADLREASAVRQRANGFSMDSAMLLTARSLKTLADGRVSWRSDPRLTLKSPIYLTEEQVLAYLSRIRAPALLILGDAGLLQIRTHMPRRYAQTPHMEIITLPGGHFLHMEEPEPVARLLADFLLS